MNDYGQNAASGISDKYLNAAKSQQAGCGTSIGQDVPSEPDLVRIVNRAGTLCASLIDTRSQLDDLLNRLGKVRAGSDQALRPCRSGVLGEVEDTLDNIGSVAADLDEIRRLLDGVA